MLLCRGIPISGQIDCATHWQSPRLKRPHHVDENRRFIRTLGSIAPKMHISTTTAELAIQIAKSQ